MNIVLVSTFEDFGGAAKACGRLFRALRNHPKVHHITMLAAFGGASKEATAYNKTFLGKIKVWLHFILERLYFLFYEDSISSRYAFSPAIAGLPISKHKAVLEADVIHLHWVNFGLVSVNELKKLVELKKPIVWTFHDMWAFTGGCHYAEGCTNFMADCGYCKYLKKPSQNDLSFRVHRKKRRLIDFGKINVVTCSSWLANEARSSSLLKAAQIQAIPNPINTSIFKPLPTHEFRKKYKLEPNRKYLLFGAFSLDDSRKGFDLLVKVIQKLPPQKITLLFFGKIDDTRLVQIPIPYHSFGIIQDQREIAEIYNLSDVFLLPSRFDNLPNTAMEALSCGIPCVAFNVGGIPDLIHHRRNGYLAKPFEIDDFVNGILEITFSPSYNDYSNYAREKVLSEFSETRVAEQYIDLYDQRLSFRANLK